MENSTTNFLGIQYPLKTLGSKELAHFMFFFNSIIANHLHCQPWALTPYDLHSCQITTKYMSSEKFVVVFTAL